MKIVEHKCTELKAATYNPRKITDNDRAHLQQSLKTFGMVDPIIINRHKSRDMIVIGGHRRLIEWQELGNKVIPCVEVKLTKEKEQELNIRLNRNQGEFDYDLLEKYFPEADLLGFGFEESDFSKNLDRQGLPIINDPELEITPELHESQNYIILAFDNDIDWQTAQEKLGIKSVMSKASKKGTKYVQRGKSRVINGSSILENL